jgi:hypothetical protein
MIPLDATLAMGYLDFLATNTCFEYKLSQQSQNQKPVAGAPDQRIPEFRKFALVILFPTFFEK